jgi:alkylation response protein AidB-like acyl-CoA dehydrogenase
LPEPLAATAAVAVPALRDHAQSDDAVRWLIEVSSGQSTIGVGLRPNPAVLHAATADVFLLEADDGLHLVDRDVVELVAHQSVDGSRRMCTVEWTPSPATLMSGRRQAVTEAHARAAIASAAELCGLADSMVAQTVAYVSERRQFGVPVGSFQAIKHHLADALLALEFAKPLVWRAADSTTRRDPQASLHASMAKAAASDAARVVGVAALQCHGAIGYTVECDLHLWLKRSWALQAQDGDAAAHRRKVADQLLG